MFMDTGVDDRLSVQGQFNLMCMTALNLAAGQGSDIGVLYMKYRICFYYPRKAAAVNSNTLILHPASTSTDYTVAPFGSAGGVPLTENSGLQYSVAITDRTTYSFLEVATGGLIVVYGAASSVTTTSIVQTNNGTAFAGIPTTYLLNESTDNAMWQCAFTVTTIPATYSFLPNSNTSINASTSQMTFSYFPPFAPSRMDAKMLRNMGEKVDKISRLLDDPRILVLLAELERADQVARDARVIEKTPYGRSGSGRGL